MKKVEVVEKLKTEANELQTTVHSLEVRTRVEYEKANDLTKACIELEKQVKSYFEKPKNSAFETHKKLVEMEKEQLEPLTKMKRLLKAKMTTYITQETAYTDAVHMFITAVKKGEKVLEVFDNEALSELVEYARVQSEKRRTDVEPEKFLEEAREVLGHVEKHAPVEVEVKAVKQGLRKLSLQHSIEVTSLVDIVEAVASGKAPIEWLQVNVSEIVKTAKSYEDEEQFNHLYSGVRLTIERSVR